MWLLTAVHPGELSPERVLAAVDAELETLGTLGPTEEELERCRTAWLTAHHRSMDRLANRVRMLGRFELLFGDPGRAVLLPELYATVTAADVAAAARALRTDSRALLRAVPGEGR
jgi:predicted Zn-dependent peptidase